MTENSVTLTNIPPHSDVHVLVRGNIDSPKRALILLHGRGASAENILGLTRGMELSPDVLLCAPQANGDTWYPQRFIVPRTENEPHLSSALHVVDELIAYCRDTYGLKTSSIVLAGFSQGACLVSEYVASRPAKYAGVCIYSGGLIGADDEIAQTNWSGDLQGTRIYIGCDEQDPHIPAERVQTTASIMQRMGADVTSKLYTHLGHSVHPQGIAFLSDLLH